MSQPIICLMGPTASGKTPLAIELVDRYPFEIISVDSAMIYRGMDIGTAKPSPEILKIAPHRLIDFLDPHEAYSAGQFCQDVLREITEIHHAGHIPLLVGGTMMYYRALQQGLANLPSANHEIRQKLQQEADQIGWEQLHQRLTNIDPEAANRIKPTDKQRIQRALEVYELTGLTITHLQNSQTEPLQHFSIYNLALIPENRGLLHQRIEQRFDEMLKQGFLEEVELLYRRNDLSPDLPSIRAVGYRQAWDYLTGKINQNEMRDAAIAATRQLAKRQLTWLRTWPNLYTFPIESTALIDNVIHYLDRCGFL